MGIGSKCFEILENKPTPSPLSFDSQHGNAYDGQDGAGSHIGYAPLVDGEVTDDEQAIDGDIEDEEDVADAEEDDDLDAGDVWDDDEDDDDSAVEMAGSRRPKLRLREILFYDDKILLFKARHGRL
jgi:hypothetical protein